MSSDRVRYCERFLELIIDLEALLPTRRFFNTVMDDCHLVVHCQMSNLVKSEAGNLFSQVYYNVNHIFFHLIQIFNYKSFGKILWY